MSSPSISSEVLFNKLSMVNPCAFSLSIAAKFTFNVILGYLRRGHSLIIQNLLTLRKVTSSLVWLDIIRLTRH